LTVISGAPIITPKGYLMWVAVFFVAWFVADYFGWSTQIVLIGAVVGLLMLVSDLESEVTHARNMIADLEEKLDKQKGGVAELWQRLDDNGFD